MAKLLFFN